MEKEEILHLIKAALADVAPTRKADFANVELETSIESLGLDSIATMEMVGFIEEKVDSTFPDEELAKVNHLKDLAGLITSGRVAG
jgi:acyl carrier protein